VTVVVRPTDIRLEPLPGETVLAAAEHAGLRWPTVCGGHGTCRTCGMTVEDGRGNCSPISDWEAEGLTALKQPLDGTYRLACQTTVSGDVVVRKGGVKRARAAS
jgi:ferredoxin, 2Fe-2S